MALTESTIEDNIQVVGDYRNIQIRTARVIYDDGVEVTRTYSRKTIECCTKASGTWADTDVSGESTEVQGIAAAVWTSAVKTAYKAHVDGNAPADGE